MSIEKLKNLGLILIVILILIGVPYLLYTLGSLIEINYFGYINNWWLVLLFLLTLIAYYVLRGLDFEKKMGPFFLMLFTCSFFILGIRFGVKSNIDMESYQFLVEKEQQIDQLDDSLVLLENELIAFNSNDSEEQTSQNSHFKNHEIIFFKPDNAELSEYNKDKITAFVSNLDNCTLNINGYSDDSGIKSSNLEISMKRAQHVADFIGSIKQQNIIINKVVGFGDEHELVENKNEMARSKNRRVTIEIVGGANEVRAKKIQDEINKNRAEINNLKVERDSLRVLIFPEIEE